MMLTVVSSLSITRIYLVSKVQTRARERGKRKRKEKVERERGERKRKEKEENELEVVSLLCDSAHQLQQS